jgi:malonyl-CoA O-methyltransferase
MREFNRFATNYDKFSYLQYSIARELVSNYNFENKNILDIGCGSGFVIRNIDRYNRFIGIDIATNMCQIHPKNSKIELINQNFDDDIDIKDDIDIIISSSSLQWSKDIPNLLKKLKKYSDNILFSIFTNKTFIDIYRFIDKKSFLPSKDYLIKEIKKEFKVKHYVNKYRLYFDNRKDVFEYIKYSGLNSNGNILSYREAKRLINSYPYNYLDVEVIFFRGGDLCI